MTELLRRVTPNEVSSIRQKALDPNTVEEARRIVEDVRDRGEIALREHAMRLGDLDRDGRLIYDRHALERAAAETPPEHLELLRRTAARIRRFAEAQLSCFSKLTIEVPGGQAGHELAPVDRAGCYAPGGRFPLPSTVLMTAVTARVAGVRNVWVASPRPTSIMLAAAAVAGADTVLAVGGAQAIAALGYGADGILPCDVIVGPGNRWVTAAKYLVAGDVRIDMLAGPSELVVLADQSADASLVAADLLAQAEHDPDARAILVTPSESLLDAVERALAQQLADLPTAGTARLALRDSLAVVTPTLGAGVDVCNKLAPEHLQINLAQPSDVVSRVRHYGALFIGQGTPVVLGDYGIGPNHVLPTGGTARWASGLSVLTFLRVRTWLRLDDTRQAEDVLRDSGALARLEGLQAHARSAARRL